jgi:hypothetical protein
MHRLALALSLITAPAFAQQPPLTAAEIMARVAANQDASEAARAHFVYVQHARILSRKGKTIRCEETTDTRITPTDKGSQQQLLKLQGRLLQKGKYLTYTELPETRAGTHDTAGTDHDDLHIAVNDTDDDPMDRDLVENMRKNLTASHSKDGISANLFPLTTKAQPDYDFHLLGRAPMNGHECFHLTFAPKDKDDFGWKGDAWIDATAFQPVLLRTTMGRKVPLAVRLLLGTDVPGLGFAITYAPQPTGQPDAVWFPATFGTEFKLRVLFFLSRQIVFNAENRDFERTHVTSTIHSADTPD